jgi:hypothetical protein
MKTKRQLSALLLAVGLVCASALQFGQPAFAVQDSGAKQDMKKAGHETKDAAKDASNGTKQGTKKAYHKTKAGTKKAYSKTKSTTKGAVDGAKDGAKKPE